MEFDWPKAIARNRDDLIEIVTRLFVMAGLRTGAVVIALPRCLHTGILAILRPAEFAARRLIAMAALRIKVVIANAADRRESRPPNSVILGLDPRTHSEVSARLSKTKDATTLSIIVGCLRLHGMGPRVKPEDDARCKASRQSADTTRDMAFALFDPFKPGGSFWLDPDEDNDGWLPAGPDLDPYRLFDARSLVRRIRALEHALQDLDAQALRLARWRARRGLDSARPRRWSPMRPGRPPGWKKRPKTDVEEVLKECHFLATDAWHDTS